MSVNVCAHIGDRDGIAGELNSVGNLVVHIGESVAVFIPRTHIDFVRLCAFFGLAEGAPGGGTESAKPAGDRAPVGDTTAR